MKVQFTTKQAEKIESMAQDLQLKPTDIIAKAMSLYQIAFNNSKEGNKIAITKEGDIVAFLKGII